MLILFDVDYDVDYKYCFVDYEFKKIRMRLDLLSIPQSGGKKCQNV